MEGSEGVFRRRGKKKWSERGFIRRVRRGGQKFVTPQEDHVKDLYKKG